MTTDYILTSDGELYHYGVKGMKWGVKKTSDLPIGQNYRSVQVSSGGSVVEPEEDKYDELDDALDMLKRYSEAGKIWLESRLSTSVVDSLTNKGDPISWEEAKVNVNRKYRYTDKKKLK